MSDDVLRMLQAWTPVASVAHVSRDTATLFFQDGHQGEYFLRGAISFPRMWNNAACGAVVMGGVSTKTKRVHLFSELLWTRTKTWMDPRASDDANSVAFGLDSFLRNSRAMFCVNKYFWCGEETMKKRIGAELREQEVAIGFFPQLIEIRWPDGDYARPTLAMAFNNNLLVERPNSATISEALQFVQSGGDNTSISPRVEALVHLLTGLSKWPWRKERADYL